MQLKLKMLYVFVLLFICSLEGNICSVFVLHIIFLLNKKKDRCDFTH
jgi:hypothetical protein